MRNLTEGRTSVFISKQDGLTAPEVHIVARQVGDALVVAKASLAATESELVDR